MKVAIRFPSLFLLYLREGPNAVLESQVGGLIPCNGERIEVAYRELQGDDPLHIYLQETQRRLARWLSWQCIGAPTLYALTRILQPTIVVETGVANGVSSAFILSALKCNSKGHLYSIDLGDLQAVPEGRQTGWVVAEGLRNRWTLLLGNAKEMLPDLVEELPHVDLFLHDSDHSYDHMMWEFGVAWQHLSKAGLLLSDDIWMNNAFFDFGRLVGRKATPLFFTNIGGLRK